MCLANNIRFLRKQREMSQEQLAEILGYKSYTTIQKWESGISEPPLKQLRKMADLFGVDINDMASVNMELSSDAKNPQHQAGYYLDDETAQAAQEIFENRELRALFDVQRDMDPDDLRALHSMALALKRKERYNGDDPA